MIKRLLTLVLVLTISSQAFALCDFKNDIKENQDGSYTYTRSCHVEAGKAFGKVSLLEDRISLLEKKIELKDLTIDRYDKRTELWIDTSFELNDKLQKYENLKSQDRWVSFGLGIGVAILSVWAAGQIDNR